MTTSQEESLLCRRTDAEKSFGNLFAEFNESLLDDLLAV